MGYKVTFAKIDNVGRIIGDELSEVFIKETTRRKWISMIQRNGYEVTGLGIAASKEGARV